jgi:hypothetical protein
MAVYTDDVMYLRPCIASATSACSNFPFSTASTPSLKSGISSARSSFRDHLTVPSPSTPKLPAVCHLLPLSVDLTLMPSSFSFDTLEILPRTCQKLDVPSPHAAYASRSASTMIVRLGCVFLRGSGTAASQRSVEAWSLWETAMKWMSGWAGAILRRFKKVFSATVAVSRIYCTMTDRNTYKDSHSGGGSLRSSACHPARGC